jgi:hypothetical protein
MSAKASAKMSAVEEAELTNAGLLEVGDQVVPTQ